MTKQRISSVIAWLAFYYVSIFVLLLILTVTLETNGVYLDSLLVDVTPFIELIYVESYKLMFYPFCLILNYILVGNFRLVPWRKLQ